MIDPRHLANLLAVAKHGSFNRAAAALGLSQPALSNSIAQLERRLGSPVLARTRRGSTLNEFGEILVRSAQTMEALLAATQEEVRLKRLGIHGPLRIGATPSMMLKFVPDVTARLLREQPSTAISLSEGLDDQLLPALKAGELDMIFGPVGSTVLGDGDLAEEALFDDPFSIGVGARNPLSRRKSLTLGELRDHPWILPGPGNALRRHYEAIFSAAGVPWPTNCVMTTSLAMIESILMNTNHVTMITSTLAHAWRVKSVTLKGAGKRTIGIKRRRVGKISELTARAIQIAHEVAESVEAKERASKQR